MQLLSIGNIFSGNIARAVCWMLVHSLWMGLALTIITGIIILSTKRKTALLRYNLLSAALLLFTIGIITVLVMQVTASSTHLNQQVATSTAAAIIDTNNNIQAFTITEDKASFTSSIINFFNSYANSIVMIWFVIIAFRCVQLIGGLRKIKQIKTTQLLPVGEQWSNKLAALSTALKIKIPVQFFQSGLAKIPMVVGHFKPVILFPVGLIASLPAAEVEAVLLHELAHIRRKDYLVNMLQHFVEILFFFNPAILWVSALIKMERENCCDDIAISQSSSKRNYINALVSFQEYHLNAPQYATAIADNKKHLLQRVKRMLYNNNKTLNAMEKTFLTLCFIVTISLTVFFSKAQNNGANNAATIAVSDTTLADRHYNPADYEEGSNTSYSETINGVTHTLYLFKRQGKLYEIYGDITSFKINGKAIPQSQWGKYKTFISQLRADYQASHVDMGQELGMPNDKQRLEEKKLAEQLLSQTNKMKLDEMQQELLLKQDKLTAEQKQSLADADKFSAEQKELLMQLEKLKMEQDTQSVQLKKEALMKADAKTQLLKLNEEQRKMNADQIKLLKEKLKAERDAQQLQEQKLKAEKEDRKIKADNKVSDADDKAAAADSRTAEADSKAQQMKSKTSSSSKREIERIVDDGSKVIKTKLSYTENAAAYNATKPAYKDYETPYKKGSHIVTGIQTSDFSNSAKDVNIELLTNNIIADLKKEKVITSEANLSYKVNNDVLIVNGQTQPEALHQMLKTKYIKSPDWNLLYNYTINTK